LLLVSVFVSRCRAGFGSPQLEHDPQKCERFCDQIMLHHFETGASSYRLGDSTQAERALDATASAMAKGDGCLWQIATGEDAFSREAD